MASETGSEEKFPGAEQQNFERVAAQPDPIFFASAFEDFPPIAEEVFATEQLLAGIQVVETAQTLFEVRPAERVTELSGILGAETEPVPAERFLPVVVRWLRLAASQEIVPQEE